MSLPLHSRSWAPDPAIYTRVILGLVLPGVGLTTVLLGLYGYAAWNTVSRRYLDRVSFRLLTYALVAHLCFGTFFTVGALTASPGWRCALLSFITNSALVFSAGMFFSIALNLLLVLAFNRNGRKMEKYYVLGISLLVLISNLAPYVSGHLGWDEVNETCWYRSEDPAAMLRWLVGTQTVWVLLASLGEVVAFIILMGYLLSYGLTMRNFSEDTQTTYSSDTPHRPGFTILRFRNIILRIGLYPLVSCMFNISTAVMDFYFSRNYKVKHIDAVELNWRLNLADLAIYSGRPLIYGLLAATDPSFIRALRALRHPENESEVQLQAWGRSATMSTVIDLQDEVWVSELELDKNGSGSSTQSQTGRCETFPISTPGTDPEVAKERRPDNGNDQNETRVIDVMSHI
ncbi:hypothetical protein MSAN_00421400 [Mycena sanguinolenta]|uniref:G-protein coupled receptors family 2 profile 2 domain-containing protein n=1 Tax=Mycena sanguinolenta TaxID=230812 RepID=A0A8H7DJA1_9AGAR|nr:hypothetical protein MSAN_00421400 [Mycena sanguinolenta]